MWRNQKLGSVGRFVTGKTPPTSKPELFGDIFPFITPTDIFDSSMHGYVPERHLSSEGADYLRSLKLPRNAICYTCIASVGKIIITSSDSFTNQQINSIVIDSERHDYRFVYFLLKHKTPQIKFIALAGGVTSPIINKTAFENLEVSLPDIRNQEKIGLILSAYDDLIENNEKRIRALEEMAQLLYAEWFVKFKFPGHEKVRMVNSGTEYGKIPEGWEVKRLEEVAGIVRGCSYSSEEIDDFIGDYYIVNLKSFNRGGGFRFDGAKYYSGSINENQYLKTGDIVVAVTDMTNDRAVIARPARIPEIDKKTTFSADVVKINSDILPSSFVYEILSSHGFTETTKQKANGANVLHLKPAAILEFIALIPDSQLLKKFDVLCEPIAREVDKLLMQNDNLSKIRDLLIPQLVTGKRELK